MEQDYRDTNLLQETLEELESLDKEISWARIQCDYDVELPKEQIILAPNHSQEELENFFRSLNFNYDSGYGGQHVFGWIVFTDKTWLSREEYDGSEWWQFNKCPQFENEHIPT